MNNKTGLEKKRYIAHTNIQMWRTSNAEGMQNLSKRISETKRASFSYCMQHKEFVFLPDSKPTKPWGCADAQWLQLSEVGSSEGSFSFTSHFPGIFLLLSPSLLKSTTPWALDQSGEHQVSPHNLSLKGIIIRSLRPEPEKYEACFH